MLRHLQNYGFVSWERIWKLLFWCIVFGFGVVFNDVENDNWGRGKNEIAELFISLSLSLFSALQNEIHLVNKMFHPTNIHLVDAHIYNSLRPLFPTERFQFHWDT